MRYYVGVDTGGTFTDVVMVDDQGRVVFDKAFSTPRNPAEGVLAALENCAALLGLSPARALPATDRFSHGTTVGTNALIQRRGARVGLLMTRGFEDTTLITRGPMGKNLGIPPAQAMDFIHNERPEPLVARSLIRGVPERLALDGEVVAPLDEAEAARALQELAAAGAESLAVCLLWSFRDDAHERRIKALARQVVPQLPVSLSSEVSPVLGEYERAMTTVVNAYIGPVMVRYVNALQAGLEALGLRHPVQLMQCSGGVSVPQHVEKQAVSLINSGPIGGLVAARFLGQVLGYQNIITTDMGGTSFDVGVIHRGEYEAEQTPFIDKGLPVQVPAVRVVTIGAGGGSIAWTDGRRLLVGPQSAGAEPGPACYDRGGTEPTVTDALVALGLLDPDYFFGGRKQLNPARAEAAIRERVAEPLGLDPLEAAAGIYEIVTAKMSDLIRKVTVESGYDPREFVLFAYGGAGPVHAALYGEALGVQEVIVPHTASVFSALGCALSDVKYTYARSEPMLLEPDPELLATFNRVFRELEARAVADMRASGFPAEEVVLSRKLDLRYEGQMSELTVGWERAELTVEGLGALRRRFEDLYEQRFGQGTSHPEAAMEVMTFRVEALKITEKPRLLAEPEGAPDPSAARKGHREVYLRQAGRMMATVYEGERLVPGNVIAGPAIVERRDTTILVPPGHQARMDGYRNIRIKANV